MCSTGIDKIGGMAEWSKAAVLKTVNRKVRGFESCSLRHILYEHRTAGCFLKQQYQGQERRDG